MTKCPKCSHEQENQTECEACGVIFSKFEQAQERLITQTNQVASHEPESSSGSSLWIPVIILLIIVTVAITYYFTVYRNQDSSIPPTGSNEQTTAPSGGEGNIPRDYNKQTTPMFGGDGGSYGNDTAEPAKISGSSIEQARNGTVSIEAPWGTGSGFFISDSTIVTNKHVLVPDPAVLNKDRHDIETRRKLFNLEKERLERLRRQLDQAPEGPDRDQANIILQERERELARVRPQLEEAEANLRKREQTRSPSDVKIYLIDGSVLMAQSIKTSPNRDLALLTVSGARVPALRLAPQNSGLREGDKVYAIGSSVGLRHTVTSGIFSSYRQMKDSKDLWLQTDAPINHGNSGGPLIDEHGVVHGVNTIRLEGGQGGVQGIGLAIAIQTVIDEFAIHQ